MQSNGVRCSDYTSNTHMQRRWWWQWLWEMCKYRYTCASVCACEYFRRMCTYAGHGSFEGARNNARNKQIMASRG
eukprot:10200633-Alexandrium_andersonii.AAC.1